MQKIAHLGIFRHMGGGWGRKITNLEIYWVKVPWVNFDGFWTRAKNFFQSKHRFFWLIWHPNIYFHPPDQKHTARQHSQYCFFASLFNITWKVLFVSFETYVMIIPFTFVKGCIYPIQAKDSMADHQVAKQCNSKWYLVNMRNIRQNMWKSKADHSVPGVQSIQWKDNGAAGPDWPAWAFEWEKDLSLKEITRGWTRANGQMRQEAWSAYSSDNPTQST